MEGEIVFMVECTEIMDFFEVKMVHYTCFMSREELYYN